MTKDQKAVILAQLEVDSYSEDSVRHVLKDVLANGCEGYRYMKDDLLDALVAQTRKAFTEEHNKNLEAEKLRGF